MLANLLDNAARHTPAGGRVEIRAGHEDGEVTVAVSDTGEGITPAQLPRLFERFYRADPARRQDRGSGIGLTIARAIARGHDGDVTAASDGPGHGATFTLSLPASATARPPDAGDGRLRSRT